MKPFGYALALLVLTCWLGAAAVRPAPSTECRCLSNYTLTITCPCTIVIYDLELTHALCTHPACLIIVGNVCTAEVTFAFGLPCTGGPYTLSAKAPCDGSGSSSKRCPGGTGSVDLMVDCATNCTPN